MKTVSIYSYFVILLILFRGIVFARGVRQSLVSVVGVWAYENIIGDFRLLKILNI